MALIEEHCKDCFKSLGKDFREVHEWLDEFFPTMGFHHRIMRHHKDGVEEARKKWGDEGAKAAELHIIKDCYGKVPTKEEAQLWDLLT
jgi:hypothetical protein